MAYRTAPAATPLMPPGIPYIIGNELAERFSFYGMRAILYVFMTTALVTHEGAPDLMSEAEAKKWTHLFIAAVYFTPLIGAFLADLWLGKYRTIIALSLVYCAGHLVLAVDNTRAGLMLGLGLIALGAGGIKPCVSAHVGDQFGRENARLIPRAFNWFYLSINIGAAVSQLLTPVLLESAGPHVAFGVPGLLMLAATLVFWMGRHEFAHIPAEPSRFLDELCDLRFVRALAGLLPLYLLITVFWSIFDQTASAWVEQAGKMDRVVFGWEIHAAQLQAVNPFFILVLIPIFTLVIYPQAGRLVEVTPLRKIGAGFVLTLATLCVSGWIEGQISAGLRPFIGWQVLAYLLVTSAEILISVTALEFSYTQAPPRMKSVVMSLYLLSMSLGNFFTSRVNAHIESAGADAGLDGAGYYWFFLRLTAAAMVLFFIVAGFYKGRTHIQGEDAPA
ncbi:MAG TPA: POT family MFS transporter [Prosthecobacter sp.]|nr:POT family MFS transporter [Prosthecobacter sp.]HRK17100.1 POT family MFS transporter [Prosthecobacter sp.]